MVSTLGVCQGQSSGYTSVRSRKGQRKQKGPDWWASLDWGLNLFSRPVLQDDSTGYCNVFIDWDCFARKTIKEYFLGLQEGHFTNMCSLPQYPSRRRNLPRKTQRRTQKRSPRRKIRKKNPRKRRTRDQKVERSPRKRRKRKKERKRRREATWSHSNPSLSVRFESFLWFPPQEQSSERQGTESEHPSKGCGVFFSQVRKVSIKNNRGFQDVLFFGFNKSQFEGNHQAKSTANTNLKKKWWVFSFFSTFRWRCWSHRGCQWGWGQRFWSKKKG